MYFSPGSSSLALQILLEVVGLPYRLELVSAREQKSTEPAFRKINPKGRVPVLELDGVLLTEAAAILFYLAHTHPGLAPKEWRASHEAGGSPCPRHALR
jgi:glutathione S-transferase